MRKRHSPAIKAKIVLEALKEEKTITQIASENDIHPNQISTWKAAAIAGLPTLFERESKAQGRKRPTNNSSKNSMPRSDDLPPRSQGEEPNLNSAASLS